MENKKIQDIWFMTYLKVILITESSKRIVDAYGDDVVELLDGINFLLDYDCNYIYFDKFISEKIYDIVAIIRDKKVSNKEELFDKCNSILTKTNRLVNNNFSDNRKEYYEKEQVLRAGYHSRIKKEYECDRLEKEIAVCLSYDYRVLESLIMGEKITVSDNPGCVLASINYYLNECPDLCNNLDLFSAFVEIASTVKQAITICYHESLADKNAYIACCKVNKIIDKKIDYFSKKNGISKEKIKQIKQEAERNIVYKD